MARFPGSTPYLGPTACFDDQIDPEQLLRRLAYGRAAPMLGYRARLNGLFFARLLDNLANAHVVLVKCATSERNGYHVAAALRAELPAESFGIAVDHHPSEDVWNVLVYHQIPSAMRLVRPRTPEGDVWIGSREVARVLQISPCQAGRVMDRVASARRVGAGNERQIRQRDLVVLANRKGRWRKRTRKAS